MAAVHKYSKPFGNLFWERYLDSFNKRESWPRDTFDTLFHNPNDLTCTGLEFINPR